jgi:hypothetical protein
LGQLLSLVLYASDLGDFGYLIGAGLSHFLLGVERQLVVQWEDLMLEELE